MADLTLQRNSLGVISSAKIGETDLEGFISVTQNLQGSSLRASIAMDFDSVTVEDLPPEPAATLTATFIPGQATWSTRAIISTPLGAGNHFAYVISSAQVTAPNVGDYVSHATSYSTGGPIQGLDLQNNKFVGLYELTGTNRAIGFLAHEVTADELNRPIADGLTATFGPGSASGSTAAVVNASEGNSVMYKVTQAPEPVPRQYDAVSGGTAYTSGSDITGVDAVNNNNVALYEVDSGSLVLRFTNHTLTSDEIRS